VKRFGILSDNDGRMPANNRALLIQEMADVEYFINFMRREYKVDEDEFRDAYHRKCQKVNKYLYPEEKT
jgi:translation elongation factor EF-Tu-like GTPase